MIAKTLVEHSAKKKAKLVAQNCLNKERKSAHSKRTFSFKDPEIDFVACSVFFLTCLIRPSLQSPPLSPLHLSLQPPQLSRLVPFSNFTFSPTPPKPVARSSCETCFARLRVLCRKEHGLRGRGVTPWPRVRLSAFDSCVPQRVSAGPMWGILGRLALPLSDQYSSKLVGVW